MKDPKEKMVSDTGVDWLSNLIGGIMQATEPRLDISSCLHFSIILSYGTVSATEDQYSFILNSGTETKAAIASMLYLDYSRKAGECRRSEVERSQRAAKPIPGAHSTSCEISSIALASGERIARVPWRRHPMENRREGNQLYSENTTPRPHTQILPK